MCKGDSDRVQFRWTTGGDTYHCQVRDTAVGDVLLQSLAIDTPRESFREPPTGQFQAATFLEPDPRRDERFLVTQWTAGASTYEVRVHRVLAGRVQRVLRTTTSTTELGVIDVDSDGLLDLVVSERGGVGAMVAPTTVAYLWRGSAFVRLAPIQWIAPGIRRRQVVTKGRPQRRSSAYKDLDNFEKCEGNARRKTLPVRGG